MNWIKFYGTQSFHHMKKAIFVSVCLAIAVSMVVGLGIFSNSYTKEIRSELESRSFDFDFQVRFNYENILDDYDEITDILFEKTNFRSQAIFYTHALSTNNFFFSNFDFENETQITQEIPFLTTIEFSSYSVDYYNSTYFTRNFQLVEGNYPKEEHEIILDLSFKQCFSFELGDVFNCTPYYSSNSYDEDLFSVFFNDLVRLDSFLNVNVVGFYEFKNQAIASPIETIYSSPFAANSSENTNFESPILNHVPIFGYTELGVEFSNTSLYSQLNRVITNTTLPLYEEYIGFTGYYDLSTLNFNHLGNQIREFDEMEDDIAYKLSNSMTFKFTLKEYLREIESNMRFILWGLQLMNFPIILFSIFVGAFSLKVEIQGRMKEILLLKSKGTPFKVILSTILFESCLIGIVAALIGFFGGVLVFQTIKTSLNELFFTNRLYISSLVLNTSTILSALMVGVGISIFASMVSIIFVSKLSTSHIIKILGVNNTEAELEEMAILEAEKDQHFESGRKQNAKSSLIHLFTKKSNSPHQQESEEKEVNHPSSSEEKPSGKRKGYISVFFILFSFYPFFLRFLLELRFQHRLPDFLQAFTQFILENVTIFLVFIILGPVILIIGLIRFFFIEHNGLFSKILKKIIHPFDPISSYLVSLNLIRKRQYRTIILIVSIILTFFTTLNISLNSISRYENIFSNLEVGADVHVRFSHISYIKTANYQGLLNNFNITCWEDLMFLEQDLKNYRTDFNQTIFNDVLTIFQHDAISSYDPNIIHMNLTKYIGLISESGKYNVSKDYVYNFNSIANQSANSSVRYYYRPIIVNSVYRDLANVKIGTHIGINYDIYDKRINDMRFSSVYGSIYGIIDVLPGFGEEFYSQPFVIRDSSFGYQSNQSLLGMDIHQMLDINYDCGLNQSEILSIMTSIYLNYTRIHTLGVYEQDWQSFQQVKNQDFRQTFGVFYLEFYLICSILSIGFAILLQMLQDNDEYQNGVLLARGLGRQKLISMVFIETTLVYLIGYIFGLLSGVIFINSTIPFSNLVIFPQYGLLSLPIYWNWLDIVKLMGFIPVITFIVYGISAIIKNRKPIKDFFYKF